MAKDALAKIETHEKECAIRFKAIEERLERGSQRMDRMEMSVWGVYPFILASVFLAKYLYHDRGSCSSPQGAQGA